MLELAIGIILGACALGAGCAMNWYYFRCVCAWRRLCYDRRYRPRYR